VLLRDGISFAAFSLIKNRTGQVREISAEFLRLGLVKDVKFILFLDEGIDITDLSDMAWIASNNIDPMRDCFRVYDEDQIPFPVLVIDGTRKTHQSDGFERDWPNIIVMDEATIKNVDSNWEKFNLGPFLPSPSLKYMSLIINDGAMVKE
jgi:4-hydroxy-3-polyprenylbenzoate decarboxylase